MASQAKTFNIQHTRDINRFPCPASELKGRYRGGGAVGVNDLMSFGDPILIKSSKESSSTEEDYGINRQNYRNVGKGIYIIWNQDDGVDCPRVVIKSKFGHITLRITKVSLNKAFNCIRNRIETAEAMYLPPYTEVLSSYKPCFIPDTEYFKEVAKNGPQRRKYRRRRPQFGLYRKQNY